MLLELSIFAEDEEAATAKTDAFKHAVIAAFPSKKLYKTLFTEDEEEDEGVTEMPIDSPELFDEIQKILSSVGIGSDEGLPVIEEENNG